MTFPEMIEKLYRFQPNNCLVLYYENGKHYRKIKNEKILVEKDEIRLFDVMNPDGKMIVVIHASKPPIADRI